MTVVWVAALLIVIDDDDDAAASFLELEEENQAGQAGLHAAFTGALGSSDEVHDKRASNNRPNHKSTFPASTCSLIAPAYSASINLTIHP